MSDILNLAYLRIVRNRKNSLLFFLVLLLSFASAIVSVSVVGSIDHTNAQYRLNTYGKWYFAIPYGYDSDGEWLSQKKWVDSLGTAQSVGTISASKIIGLGTIDETLIDIGHIRLDQGTFPSSDSEIAMEMDSLSALGYDYTLGQEITFTVMLPLTNGQKTSIEKTYTLCGIIHEYTDLWYLQHNQNNAVLNSAVISNTAAAELIAEAGETLIDGGSVHRPVPQYFIYVSEENRSIAQKHINSRLSERFGNPDYPDGGDTAVSVNTVAYGNSSNSYKADYDDFYMYIIALLAFVSILCLEIIRLPSDTHSFSVLRSVGMSKGQLGLMQIFETLLLGIPAILLGLPLGAGLTWLVLRLMLYSGSVPIQVYIPYQTLFFILGLWLAAIVISRLIMFVFTLRVPMIGRFQMNTSKSKGARIIRSGFIVLLLFVSSASVIFTGMESLSPEFAREYWSKFPSYTVQKTDFTDNLAQTDINVFEKTPGISEAYGVSELYIGLSFDGLSEKDVYLSAVERNRMMNRVTPSGMVFLFVIDENYWTDIIDFGSNKTAFHNGEFVYVSVPDDGKGYPLPKEEAVLSVYEYEVAKIAKLIFNDKDSSKYITLLANYTVSTQVMQIPEGVANRGVTSIETPYTVICSEHFFQNLLDTLPEGRIWSTFMTGNKFGYREAFLTADLNSDDLSTDIVIAKICKNMDIQLFNNRQEGLAHVQENVQYLIMLYFSGACICIIALMILWSNVSLEAKNEKQSFLIKRCIGMSKRQINFNIFGKSLFRCLSAYLISWIMYMVWAAFAEMRIYENSGDNIDFIRAIRIAIYGFKYDNCSVGRIVIISLIGLVIPLILILYVKKELSKDGDAK